MGELEMINPDKKKLFTPGPLTTSSTVKQAMLIDLGSRDKQFISLVSEIRQGLLSLIGPGKDYYESIIMQGSGTFGVESVISSTVPPNGKLVVLVNGTYGHRMARIARCLNIETTTIEYEENQMPCVEDLERLLENDPLITNVAIVHCETTTGIINQIDEIGAVAKKFGASYFVDAMSSFGAVSTDVEKCNIDFLVSSSNKCIEGVPGFSFIIAKRSSLKQTKGFARSVSLDLFEQWENLEKTGQFRFTPPVHSLLAFGQAIAELKEEGGVEGRAARYKENHETLVEGTRRLGFKEYLDWQVQGHIITSFHYPTHKNFSFDKFYSLLNDKGMVIYPGKLSKVDCFRVGNTGRLYKNDFEDLLRAIEEVLVEMNVPIPVS